MEASERANGVEASLAAASWWSDLLRLFVSDRGLKLRLNIPDTLIIDQGCISVWYQTSDDGYINKVATSKTTREAFRRRCEEKFTADACNPEEWIAVARSLGPGNQEISQLLRREDLEELLSGLQDASESTIRSPRSHSNGKARKKALPAEQLKRVGFPGEFRCPHCVQVYVPPSLDQRFVTTCIQEGDGLRCNTTVRLYSRRYVGNLDEEESSARSPREGEESRPLQDVRLKTDIRRAASSLITYIEKAHGHRLVALIAEFVRGLEGRIYLTAVHSAKWAQYISETTGLQSAEHAPAGGLATSPRQTLKPSDFPLINTKPTDGFSDKPSIISEWIRDREREARSELSNDPRRTPRLALSSPRKESPRGAGLVAVSGHHPPPYNAFQASSPQRGPGNPSTSSPHSPSRARAPDTRFWTYGGRDKKCDAELAATLSEEVEASREQVQRFYQELQATKRRLHEKEDSLAEQHSVYNAMVRQLTSQFLEAKNNHEAETKRREEIGSESQRIAKELAAVTKERDELRELLHRERDAAMAEIVEHSEMQKELKEGEAQLLKDLAASRAECSALRKALEEEKEVVVAVSRQLVDYRERYGRAEQRDAAAQARGEPRESSAGARRAPAARSIVAALGFDPVPLADSEQSSGLNSGPTSPRGKTSVAINIEDLLVSEEDSAGQLNAVHKRLGGADELLQEIYAFYSMLGKSYTDTKRPSMNLLQFGKFVRDVGMLKRPADSTGVAIPPVACDAVFAKAHALAAAAEEGGEPTLSYAEFLEGLVRLAAIRYTLVMVQNRGDVKPPHLAKRLALLLENDVLTRARRRLITVTEKKKLGLTASNEKLGSAVVPTTPGRSSA